MRSQPPLALDLLITFAVQFVIFYFIMTRLNTFLGIGRLQGALVLAVIFTGLYVFLSRNRRR